MATEGREVVLALSKWDLVEDKQKVLAEVHSQLEDVLPEIRGVPVVTISAKQELGVDKLLKAVFEAVSAGVRASQPRNSTAGLIRRFKKSTARTFGTAHQNPLCDAGELKAANLCGFRKPDGKNAGKL